MKISESYGDRIKVTDSEYEVKDFLRANHDCSFRAIYIKDLDLWAIGDSNYYIHLTLLNYLFQQGYIDTDLKPLQYMYSGLSTNNFVLYFFENYSEELFDQFAEECALQKCPYSYVSLEETIMVGCSDKDDLLRNIL